MVAALEMKTPVTSFEQLEVYRDSCAFDQEIFELSKRWPKEEMYALTDQIRRSSRSIGANLAEGWSKRRYPAHFISKLTDADGELQETKHWLMRARDYGYMSEEQTTDLLQKATHIGRRLGAMLSDPSWTGRSD